MKNRILITSCGRKVSLIRAFKEAGWWVVGQDSDEDSAALRFCDEIGTLDTPVDLVLPTRDAELKLGTHRASDETIDICTDKLKFYHWCKKNGFKTPEVYFVKPRISKSGKETECVWQEMIEGEEYSVDLFADFQSCVISVVPRKRIKVVNGESCITKTVMGSVILEKAVNISQRLGLVGHNVVQCLIQNQQIYFTDINCRMGGASTVAIKAGCKSPEWLLKLINGEEVKPCIGDYKVGLTGYSYTNWEFYEDNS